MYRAVDSQLANWLAPCTFWEAAKKSTWVSKLKTAMLFFGVEVPYRNGKFNPYLVLLFYQNNIENTLIILLSSFRSPFLFHGDILEPFVGGFADRFWGWDGTTTQTVTLQPSLHYTDHWIPRYWGPHFILVHLRCLGL